VSYLRSCLRYHSEILQAGAQHQSTPYKEDENLKSKMADGHHLKY